MSVHCHNDLGLAVANSLESLKYGVRQIECTINGIGERAGNASLEEIVMALYTRKDFYQKYTNINTAYIYPTSKLVSRLTGFVVQPNSNCGKVLARGWYTPGWSFKRCFNL